MAYSTQRLFSPGTTPMSDQATAPIVARQTPTVVKPKPERIVRVLTIDRAPRTGSPTTDSELRHCVRCIKDRPGLAHPVAPHQRYVHRCACTARHPLLQD